MPIRPEVSKRYRTRNGELVAITEQLGRMGFGGHTVDCTPHMSVWNMEGDNLEYTELDLLEEVERTNNADSNEQGQEE